MLMNTLWSAVGSVMGLFYFGLQVMVPCLPPAPLSISRLITDEYMGSWHFVAVSVWDEDDLKDFKTTDNSMLHIQKNDDDTLTVTESISIADQCQKIAWTYNTSVLDPFLFRSDREEKTPDEVIQKFKSKMECLYMEDFYKSPREKAQCKLDAAA